MAIVPRLPAFDAKGFVSALKTNVRRPDGNPYAVFDQFLAWKNGADRLRDSVETNRVTLVDHKADIDAHAVRLNKHDARLDVLEARPVSTFP